MFLVNIVSRLKLIYANLIWFFALVPLVNNIWNVFASERVHEQYRNIFVNGLLYFAAVCPFQYCNTVSFYYYLVLNTFLSFSFFSLREWVKARTLESTYVSWTWLLLWSFVSKCIYTWVIYFFSCPKRYFLFPT